jgi:hypothetical protein
VTKPFSAEQEQRGQERRRRELGLGEKGLEDNYAEVADREDIAVVEVVQENPAEDATSQDTTGRGDKRQRDR